MYISSNIYQNEGAGKHCYSPFTDKQIESQIVQSSITSSGKSRTWTHLFLTPNLELFPLHGKLNV